MAANRNGNTATQCLGACGSERDYSVWRGADLQAAISHDVGCGVPVLTGDRDLGILDVFPGETDGRKEAAAICIICRRVIFT